MAVDEEDCEEIARVCTKSGVLVSVCHVLRYFPPVLKIKEVIESGAIGKVVNINHTENIGYWHFAHSFVRQHSDIVFIQIWSLPDFWGSFIIHFEQICPPP